MSERSECTPRWKRATDLAVGAVLLVFLAAPMLAIALAVLLDTGRPVLIKQRRIGRACREFGMWKFRTLPKATPQLAKSELSQIQFRATWLGRLMRRYSLDEFPQLLNVIAGEMSLIGPRPALFTQDDLVALRRNAGVMCARPGLTGLAQVSGRELLTLADKVVLDAEYVRTLSPLRDLRILLLTFGAVLRSRGGY